MYNWKKTLLGPNDYLSVAIEVLNREALRIAMVVDEQGRLLGTITDGDIRRALISKKGLDSPVHQAMTTDPTTVLEGDDRSGILAMMTGKGILQVPILNNEQCVVGLETLQHLLKPKKINNSVFLMAGGFGTRLRPLTNDTPKPLLKVGNKPILETILDQFIEAGFFNFYISTHYKAEQVREHFGDGASWDVHITYVHEEKPLGTAGALGLLPEEAMQLPLVMMNGDLLTKVDLQQLLQFHNEQDCLATMCVRKYDFQVPYGVVEQTGNVVSGIIEKPIQNFFVNAGIYVLDPEIVRSVANGQSVDMPKLLGDHIDKNEKVAAFPIHESWLDIGRLEEYERANREAGGE